MACRAVAVLGTARAILVFDVGKGFSPLEAEAMPINQTILLVAAVVILAAATILMAVTRKKHPPKVCGQCGKASSYGYSNPAEAGGDEIVPLCVDCLLQRLDEDYLTYGGRAVVVQPVAELPCYLFRPKADWGEAVRSDLDFVLAGLEERCRSCGQEAHYAWVNALEPAPVGKLPKMGIRQTLLTAGARPVPLCARCTVRRLGNSLRAQEGGYLEVRGPRGSEDGVVCGMGY